MAQYTVYEEPATGATYRDGVRDSHYVIDVALTELGFLGDESLDGITGDWFCLQKLP